MEYKRISDLENTYPQPGNYILNKANKSISNLYGIYPDKNKLEFKIPNLDELKYVEDTSFRFILAIFKDYKDTKPLYYTSEKYYNDLKASSLEGNPYFVQSSFENSNIVSYVYEDVVRTYESMKALEQKSRVNFRTNIFIGVSGSVDYDNLVTFIDWLVDKPSPLDDDNFGVLQPTTISGWDVYDGNFSTGEVKTTISASYGIGATFINGFDALTLAESEAELKLQQDRLNKIKIKIESINSEIKSKSNYKYPLVSDVNVTIDGVFYGAPESFFQQLGNKQKRAQRLTDVLLSKINELNSEKLSIETSVSLVQSKVTQLKSQLDNISKAKAEFDKAKSLVNDLKGKIPKIPKLPPIPKIPKLPSVNDLLTMLPIAIPALPALPKLPSLPKKPSFKLPPLKLFKPKKPKEPKKLKKNKGKGIKGAMGDLQNAVNSAQSAVAGAAAAAAGAVASVQAAANQATSAVANAQSAVANAQSAVKGVADNAKSSVQSTIDAGKDAVKSTTNNIPKV